MKVDKSSESRSVKYDIESKPGSLECTFYHENVEEYFYTAFSKFAENQDDFHSKTPSFEKYIQKATEIFAEPFPKRLEELIDETVEEVELRTLMETEKISLSEARQSIRKAIREGGRRKKERLHAPVAGRPKEWKSQELQRSIVEIVTGFKFARQQNSRIRFRIRFAYVPTCLLAIHGSCGSYSVCPHLLGKNGNCSRLLRCSTYNITAIGSKTLGL